VNAPSKGPPFYGKYRGVVTDTLDPLRLGRIRAKVPDVLGREECGWALPCAPFGGSGTGLFCLPKQGAPVWIEFEHGDPDYPIWVGVFWTNPADRPPALLAPTPFQQVILRSEAGNQITLDDSPSGGITLKTALGQSVTLSATGVVIDNGLGAKVELQAVRAAIKATLVEVGG
jgi:uncharacterized protein involved in type VI secretion and phage assembly